MPITLFYHFVITFADATRSELGEAGKIDRLYHIVESPQHRWTISENAQPVALAEAQHARLAQLLAALSPAPDPAIEPHSFGSDGTWITVAIQRAAEQLAYRWWVRPPAGWDALAAITEFVQQLADAPRAQQALHERQLTRQFFEYLAARDLASLLELYHPDIHYSNPFFDLRGAEADALWRMAWNYLPDLRVVCTESDIRGSSVYWRASYTYPPTGRYIEQQLTANLSFADDLIVQHVDRFNVHEWAQAAYGVFGGMLGGWRVFERRIAARARTRLAPFLREQQRQA